MVKKSCQKSGHFCFWTIRELGIAHIELVGRLGRSPSAAGIPLKEAKPSSVETGADDRAVIYYFTSVFITTCGVTYADYGDAHAFMRFFIYH